MSASATSLPLVSVIVPARNAEATLGDSLSSAAAGSYRNIELIVIDDGSTDSTPEIAEEFARRDGRVTVHRRSSGGVSAALNSGLRLARGDYVARLDSDDLWHPDKLKRQVELALGDPAAGFIYCFVRYIDEEGRVAIDGPQQRFPRRALCRGIYESLVGGNSSALVRRSLALELGGYDENLASWEDLLLQLRISESSPIAFVPEYLVGYRVRPGSLSADPTNMLDSWRVARRRIDEHFPQVPQFVRDWAHGRRCAGFAEGFAWQERLQASTRLLTEAIRHDPAWTSRFLAFRLMRHLKRRLAKAPAAESRPLFLDCRPDRPLPPAHRPGDAQSRWLLRLDSDRAMRLAAIDEALCSAGPSIAGQGLD